MRQRKEIQKVLRDKYVEGVPEKKGPRAITALTTELKARQKELAALRKIKDILTSEPDLKRCINAIVTKARDVTRAEACTLQLIDEPFLKVLKLRSTATVQLLPASQLHGITSLVMQSGVPAVINDVRNEQFFSRKTDGFRNMRIRSLLCAPIKLRNRSIGVLRIINKRNEGQFTASDADFFGNVAYLAGTAIERAFLYARIEEISVTDDLTDLYNFRYLNRTIDNEIERANRYGLLFSIIFMDIDNFKEVNDTYGHLTGSKVLIEMAHVLRTNLRKVDMITRYGGDEFVILLPQTPVDGGFMVAERLRRTIERHVFLKKTATPVRITASFGVSAYPGKARDREKLLRMADKAMYRGKFSTKNIVFAAG